MAFGMEQQKAAVLSGYWPLMRYNPALRAQGKNPFQLDSKAPTIPLEKYAYQEARYSILARSDPQAARELLKLAQDDVERQWRVYSTQGISCETKLAGSERTLSATKLASGETE
jgi:pyruvate-ferredoxin/flavodoxin oxidoreductase